MNAAYVIQICAVIAGSMAAFFGLLLFRRWRQEARAGNDQEILSAITRSYLRRVTGQLDTEAARNWSDAQKLAAVSHMHMLLRGGERDRLMQMAELDGLLRSTLRRSHSWRSARRIEAIRLLQQFGSETCVARLREIFVRDAEKAVQLDAAFALAAIHALPPPRETIRILGMLERKSNRLDSALLRASAPQYTDQLILLLSDRMPHSMRALIVDALGWSDDQSVLPTLERASQENDPELRSAALRAAARLGNPAAADWVKGLLFDPVPFVRIQAANSCAALGLRDAIPHLQQKLSDEDLWVRLRSEHALDELEGAWPNDNSKDRVA